MSLESSISTLLAWIPLIAMSRVKRSHRIREFCERRWSPSLPDAPNLVDEGRECWRVPGPASHQWLGGVERDERRSIELPTWAEAGRTGPSGVERSSKRSLVSHLERGNLDRVRERLLRLADSHPASRSNESVASRGRLHASRRWSSAARSRTGAPTTAASLEAPPAPQRSPGVARSVPRD